MKALGGGNLNTLKSQLKGLGLDAPTQGRTSTGSTDVPAESPAGMQVIRDDKGNPAFWIDSAGRKHPIGLGQ